MIEENDPRLTPDPNAPVNSRAWWEWYFEGQWDQHDGAGQSRHFMSLVLEHLPTPEAIYLGEGASILDWGCAFGEGTALLNQAFPCADVSGLDFAAKAIETATQRHPECTFLHDADGSIPGVFDAIVTSNCLEHFAQPLDVARSHLAACRSVYIALVPYNEYPIHPSHRAQLREESFPDRLGGFVRLHTAVVKADPRWWPGEQLLVVYGSARYVVDHHRLGPQPDSRELERELSVATDQVQRLRQKLRDVTLRYQEGHRQADAAGEALRQEIEAIRASWSWRLGNRLVTLARAVPGAKRLARTIRRLVD